MEKPVDVSSDRIVERRPVLPDGIDAVDAVEVPGAPLKLRFLTVTPRIPEPCIRANLDLPRS